MASPRLGNLCIVTSPTPSWDQLSSSSGEEAATPPESPILAFSPTIDQLFPVVNTPPPTITTPPPTAATSPIPATPSPVLRLMEMLEGEKENIPPRPPTPYPMQGNKLHEELIHIYDGLNLGYHTKTRIHRVLGILLDKTLLRLARMTAIEEKKEILLDLLEIFGNICATHMQYPTVLLFDLASRLIYNGIEVILVLAVNKHLWGEKDDFQFDEFLSTEVGVPYPYGLSLQSRPDHKKDIQKVIDLQKEAIQMYANFHNHIDQQTLQLIKSLPSPQAPAIEWSEELTLNNAVANAGHLPSPSIFSPHTPRVQTPELTVCGIQLSDTELSPVTLRKRNRRHRKRTTKKPRIRPDTNNQAESSQTGRRSLGAPNPRFRHRPAPQQRRRATWRECPPQHWWDEQDKAENYFEEYYNDTHEANYGEF
jgi:hypothetical protein